MGSSVVPSRRAVVCLLIAAVVLAPRSASAVTFDGDATLASDYVQRGISETAGRGAAQLDLHLTTADGSFAGLFASTLSHAWHTRYSAIWAGITSSRNISGTASICRSRGVRP